MMGDHQIARVVRELAPVAEGAAELLAGEVAVKISTQLGLSHVLDHLVLDHLGHCGKQLSENLAELSAGA
jgi:hypothetical protein